MGNFANGEELRGVLVASMSGVDGLDITMIGDLGVKEYTYPLVAATAGTPMTEAIVGAPFLNTQPVGGTSVAAGAYRVVGVRVSSPSLVSANDTNYATFLVSSRTAAGASKTTVASQGTLTSGSGGTGDLVAFGNVNIALTAGNSVIPAGGSLTVEITKTGAGVAIPAGTIVTIFVQLA